MFFFYFLIRVHERTQTKKFFIDRRKYFKILRFLIEPLRVFQVRVPWSLYDYETKKKKGFSVEPLSENDMKTSEIVNNYQGPNCCILHIVWCTNPVDCIESIHT